MTGNAFYEFLKNIFQPWLEKEKVALPVLLFVDGHKSHATLMSTNFCEKHQIILICLFPNSTHLTQPLDVSFFGPMKKRWEDSLLDFRCKHGMRAITKSEICPLLKTTLDSKEQVIESGFQKSGLYPWNPEAVNFASMSTNPSTLDEHNILAEPVQADQADTKFFDVFEARLSEDQLREFRKQEDFRQWHGAKEETNLCQFWKKWKREIEGETHIESDDESDFMGFPEGKDLIHKL